MGEILRHLCWESQEDRVGKIIQCLTDKALDYTAGSTSPHFRPYWNILCCVLKMQDSFVLERLKHCLPQILNRCSRLVERQASGDSEFLYEVSKLLVFLGCRIPAARDLLVQYRNKSLGWGSWSRIWQK